MTRAAGQLNLSQSALSHQLTDLERDIGVSLFRRLPLQTFATGNGPDEIGRKITAFGRVVLGEMHEAERDLGNLSASDAEVLRITTECYTCYHSLPANLRPFEALGGKISGLVRGGAHR